MNRSDWNKLLIVLSLVISSTICQSPINPSGTTPIQGGTAVSAPLGLYAEKLRDCIDPSNPTNTRFPVGQTMEGLISLIERLEDNLANTTDSNLAQIKGAESVARLLLRRFRLDGVDDYDKQNERDVNLNDITNAFLGNPLWENNYYFPDYLFSTQEQCALLFSLSHNIANLNSVKRQYSPMARGKRQAISGRYRQQASDPVGSPYLVQRNTAFSNGSARHPIREEGVVSFRSNKFEAIAPARLLIGIIAGLTQNIKTQVRDVLTAFGKSPGTYDAQYDKVIDPVIALTIASLWGSGITSTDQTQDKSFYYGVSGEWHSAACSLHYSLTSISEERYDLAFKTSKGTRAELRGAIDGYIVGTALKSTQLSNPSAVRLSTILRTYYSKPRLSVTTGNTFTANYCERTSRLAQVSALQDTAQLYNAIYQLKRGGNPTNLLSEFTSALNVAAAVETQGLTDYCAQRPSGILDKTAPCETPSDVLFIIDGNGNNNLQISSDVVASVSGNLLFTRRSGGTLSVFMNSQGRNNVNPNIQLPSGPSEWPLVAAAFNTTNNGFASCRIEDFNQTTLAPVTSLAKYFQYLNQTLFNYKYWSPFFNYTGAPSTSVVVIDINTLQKATDSERNEYNSYVNQLRYRHREVRYLVASQDSQLFQDLLRDQNDRDTPGTIGNPNYNLASAFAAKSCENPAVFQWQDCHWRKSDQALYTGYVTPGYKQNWAMYPQYFLKSFNIEFRFKSDSGDIKVCYDRSFPPERQDENYCKELVLGEEKVFYISNPCKGRSYENCDPFYFTVWGKESKTQCLDNGCSSLDQIKWTVTHSGVQCNSSHFLLPSITFQVIAITISAIFYLFLNKNNKISI